MIELESMSYQYSVFTSSSKNSGNPAFVIFDFEADETQMQALAKNSGFPVVVFILKGQKYPLIRFFYPNMESSLCVHGAMAAAFAVFKNKFSQDQNILLETKSSGVLAFLINSENQSVRIKLFKKLVLSPPNFDLKLICNFLNLDSENLIDQNLPCRIESVGSPKLLVPLKDLKILGTLRPNFDLIKTWSLKNKINGLYVYFVDQNQNIFARNFNPNSGIQEDSGTGVAAGALCLILKRDLEIFQGEFIGKPSEIFAEYASEDHVWVRGAVSEWVSRHCKM